MGNSRNTKFPFGFINNNQDSTDLKSPEATALTSLDADRLALGTLEVSDYIKGTEAPDGFGVVPSIVTVAGTDFQIQSPGAPNNSMVFWEDDTGTFRAFGSTHIKLAAHRSTHGGAGGGLA